jgi:hypothetical protein
MQIVIRAVCGMALAVSMLASQISPSVMARSAASDSIANLGGPTNAVFRIQPLSITAHVKTNLKKGGKLEFAFVADMDDTTAAVERWSMVKALDQFGSFSGLKTYDVEYRVSGSVTNATSSVATYDWRDARYHSTYMTFVHYDDLSTTHPTPPQRPVYLHLPKAGQKLLLVASQHLKTFFQGAVVDGTGPPMAAGHYMRTTNAAMVPGYLTDPVHGLGLPFETIQKEIRAGYTKHYSEGVFSIDAETNAITAFICKADGTKPAKVCGRAVIKKLMKRLK